MVATRYPSPTLFALVAELANSSLWDPEPGERCNEPGLPLSDLPALLFDPGIRE